MRMALLGLSAVLGLVSGAIAVAEVGSVQSQIAGTGASNMLKAFAVLPIMLVLLTVIGVAVTQLMGAVRGIVR